MEFCEIRLQQVVFISFFGSVMCVQSGPFDPDRLKEGSLTSKYNTKYSQLILLLLFLLNMHDFSQLPDELCQCLHVVVGPFQQLVAETGDVLFDLLQFT